MSLPKNYEPQKYEDNIYSLWEEQGSFLPKNRGNDSTYSIVIPPPNANGDLHIGHAMTLALEDIAIRYHRMLGKETLFVPGADHAGFETQTVYEKQLAKEGKSRFDFGREELYKQIWDFVEENKSNYQSQLRRLGASLSWDHFTYTLDGKVIDQAYKTFKQMWDDGLIYRGERLVNYCTFHGTGFADIEVEHKESAGKIWSLRYPLTDSTHSLVVATTRPETMLGDVAVAIHPEDERYADYIGKTVKLPLTHREVPIIADDFVDREFGTGAVKITPAHDFNDFEAGERHDLPKITVIDTNGKINHNAPEKYVGLSVLEAREQVVSDLEDLGLLVETNDHQNNVGHCYKCDTVIEPLLQEQWFIDMKPLSEKATETLKIGKIKFYPESKKDQLIGYLEGLKDWNISRQIAWGIPIPAFQNIDNPNDWIFDTRVEQEIIEIDGKKYHRDPDVFDTWFSSSSWPYVATNYPDGEEYKKFYPLSLMETGGEILYPWVSRMIMMGLYVTDEIPFEEVYIHGYVMAEDGTKMSKSVGNVIAPMPVIDKYGSDALRMGIIYGRSPAVNRGYDSRRVEDSRNFCNKIWNVARYIEGLSESSLGKDTKPEPNSNADYWILSKLNESTIKMSKYLDEYRFSEAFEEIYHLIWDDLADWYLEASKTNPNISVLGYSLETILKLVHPFAPFASETIWQMIYGEESGILAVENWPKPIDLDSGSTEEFGEIINIVTEVRQIKTALAILKGELSYKDSKLIEKNTDLIQKLAKLEGVSQNENNRGLKLTSSSEELWFVIEPEVAKQYIKALKQKQTENQRQIDNLNKRLSNESYISKAPEKLVEETKQQLESTTHNNQILSNQIEQLEQV